MTANKYLGIYLNDHLAMLVAVTELAERSLGRNQGTDLGSCLESVVESTRRDRQALEALMEQQDVPHNWTKTTGAWVAERVGRLKLNGQIKGYSPLSRLVEVEALELAMGGLRCFWDTLNQTGIDEAGGLPTSELAHRAKQLDQKLDGHRRAVARLALGAPVGAAEGTPE